jgi:hypothetical protein
MRSSLAIAVGCLALLLPGCGGDDEETTTTTSTSEAATGASGAAGHDDDAAEPGAEGGEPAQGGARKEVTDAVAAAVGGGDPDVACSTGVTAGYVASAYGDEQGCRAAVTEQGGFSLVVKGVEIDGETAEATAIALEGPNANETLTVRLVLENGEWKVDFLRSDAPPGP